METGQRKVRGDGKPEECARHGGEHDDGVELDTLVAQLGEAVDAEDAAGDHAGHFPTSQTPDKFANTRDVDRLLHGHRLGADGRAECV